MATGQEHAPTGFTPLVDSILRRLRQEDENSEVTVQTRGQSYTLSHAEAERMFAILASVSREPYLNDLGSERRATMTVEEAADFLHVPVDYMEEEVLGKEVPFQEKNGVKQVFVEPLKAYDFLLRAKTEEGLTRLMEYTQQLGIS